MAASFVATLATALILCLLLSSLSVKGLPSKLEKRSLDTIEEELDNVLSDLTDRNQAFEKENKRSPESEWEDKSFDGRQRRHINPLDGDSSMTSYDDDYSYDEDGAGDYSFEDYETRNRRDDLRSSDYNYDDNDDDDDTDDTKDKGSFQMKYDEHFDANIQETDNPTHGGDSYAHSRDPRTHQANKRQRTEEGGDKNEDEDEDEDEEAERMPVYTHLGGDSTGPRGESKLLHELFDVYFDKNPLVDLPWQEPVIMHNCWLQLMIATTTGFSPNCHADGSFSSKQCYLERCWCVSKDGYPQDKGDVGRFFYKADGIRKKCVQHV